jgi:hypothetical protein
MLMIDKGYPAKSNPCQEGQELFKTGSNNIRKAVDLGTLIKAKFGNGWNKATMNIRTQDAIFLNEIMFIPVDCVKNG